MQSFLIISKNTAKRDAAAYALAKEAEIDPFDVTVVERGEGDSGKLKLSLGIEDVKAMQKKLFLKPLRGDKKAIIIKEAHLLTPEAQNALLKVLEEPPVSTIIILTTENTDVLLPTVRSRCTIQNLGQETLTISTEEKQEFEAVLTLLSDRGIGEALKQAERLSKNKDEALVWIEKMILITRQTIITDYREEHQKAARAVRFIKQLQEIHKQVKKTNVNLRLALENLFLIAST